MQERVPQFLELGSRCGDGLGIGQLELDAGLRDRMFCGPVRAAEASLRGLRQRPDPEVLAPAYLLTVEIVVASRVLEREAE
jgi:hypothetical protein